MSDLIEVLCNRCFLMFENTTFLIWGMNGLSTNENENESVRSSEELLEFLRRVFTMKIYNPTLSSPCERDHGQSI